MMGLLFGLLVCLTILMFFAAIALLFISVPLAVCDAKYHTSALFGVGGILATTLLIAALGSMETLTKPRKVKVIDKWIDRIRVVRLINKVSHVTYQDRHRLRVMDLATGNTETILVDPQQFDDAAPEVETEITEIIGTRFYGINFPGIAPPGAPPIK